MAKKKTPRKPAPKVVEEIGSGMTAGTRTTYRLDRGAGIEELREVLRQPPIQFFDNLEQVLRAFLREEGCLDDPWAALKTLEREERRSMQWYAAAVLRELVNRSRALKAGNAERATLAAYRAGALNQEARGKFKWEEDVLSHRRVREGGRKGGGREKRRVMVEREIRNRLVQAPGSSALALWKEIIAAIVRSPEREIALDDDYTFEAGNAEQELKSQVLVQVDPNGSRRCLKFRAFQTYVSRLKKKARAEK